jgi:hypothetical protein
MAAPLIYVVFRREQGEERWEVRREGSDRALSTHETRDAARDAGRSVARREHADLVVHDESEAAEGTASREHRTPPTDIDYQTLIYAPHDRSAPLRELRTLAPLGLSVGSFYVHASAEDPLGPKQRYQVQAVTVDLCSEPGGRTLHTTSVYTERAPAKPSRRAARRRR